MLAVDCGSGASAVMALSSELMRENLGGRMLAVPVYEKYVANRSAQRGEPALVCAPGALCGTGVAGATLTALAFVSPRTGRLAVTTIAGAFGASLKYADVDALLITGRATEVSFLTIDDTAVALHSAEELWGKGAPVAERLAAVWSAKPGSSSGKDDIGTHRDPYRGADFEALAIGPAGEREVRAASISTGHGRFHDGANGGALLGAMNLKSIVCRGSGARRVADAKRYEALMDTHWRATVESAHHAIDADEERRESGEELTPVKSVACQTCPIPCIEYAYSERYGRYLWVPPEADRAALARLLSFRCDDNTRDDTAYAFTICGELGLEPRAAAQTVAAVRRQLCSEAGENELRTIAEILGWTDDGVESGRMRDDATGLCNGLPAAVFTLLERVARGTAQEVLPTDRIVRSNDDRGNDHETVIRESLGICEVAASGLDLGLETLAAFYRAIAGADVTVEDWHASAAKSLERERQPRLEREKADGRSRQK